MNFFRFIIHEMSSPSFMSFSCHLLMFFQLSLCFLTSVSHISVSRGYKILVEFIGGCGKLNLHSAFLLFTTSLGLPMNLSINKEPQFWVIIWHFASNYFINKMMSPHHHHHIRTLVHLQTKLAYECEVSLSVDTLLCKTNLQFFLKEQHCSLKSTLKTD